VKVTLLALLNERLALLCGFAAGPAQNDYQRGYLDCLRWVIGEVETHERGEYESTAPGGDPLDAIRSGALLTMPPRAAILPCTPGRTHAYLVNTPRHGQKQCRHCGQTIVMEHGEKIAAGRSARRSNVRQRNAATPELLAV
jgi:hypothetical protein